MASELVTSDAALTALTAETSRRAAIRVADHIAAQYPHLTAHELAADPTIRAGLSDLFSALGLPASKGEPRA